MIRKTVAGITALLLALAMAALAVTPAAAAGPNHNGDEQRICHSTSSTSNLWTNPTLPVNAIYAAHIDPSANDTHEDDILPPFNYDVKGDGPNWISTPYPGKNMNKVFPGGYTGAEIWANGCVMPAPISVTPGYGVVHETCVADVRVPGYVTVTPSPGLSYAIVDGNSVSTPIVGSASGPLVTGEPYTLVATDADPNDKYAGSSLSAPITIIAYPGNCGAVVPVPVTPASSVEHQQCPSNVLVGGAITVDVSVPGVTYTITDLTDNSTVPFDPISGVTTVRLDPGDYRVDAVDADPNDGYELAAPWSKTEKVLEYGGPCGTPGPQKVYPDFDADPQVCVNGQFDGGYITVDLSVPGVTYTITKNNVAVPFDPATGKTGPLTPDTDYKVEAVDADPNDAYDVQPLSENVTIDPDTSGLCDPGTLAGATPEVTYTEATCAVPTGSYKLSNNQTLPGDPVPAVFWTVGGDSRAEGVSHTVPAGSTVKIVATANGPIWTLDNDLDGVIEYEHTFKSAPACVDLTTLALTGQSGSPALAVAGFLGLLGVALVRSARRATDLRREA